MTDEDCEGPMTGLSLFYLRGQRLAPRARGIKAVGH